MIQKIVLFVVCSFIVTNVLQAQVTIGSSLQSEKAALLDLKTKDGGQGGVTSEKGGFLFPRVEINDLTSLNVFTGLSDTEVNTSEQKKRHIGLAVYNISVNAQNNIEEGVYVWNGEQWEKLAYKNRNNFFYMPSIVIETSTTGVQSPIDLYGKYREQFEMPKVKSDGAPAQIPFHRNRDDLYYYVTDYDENVFENISISSQGYLQYSVKSPSVDGSSFINIVFVVK